jgi:hypothetical protein
MRTTDIDLTLKMRVSAGFCGFPNSENTSTNSVCGFARFFFFTRVYKIKTHTHILYRGEVEKPRKPAEKRFFDIIWAVLEKNETRQKPATDISKNILKSGWKPRKPAERANLYIDVQKWRVLP